MSHGRKNTAVTFATVDAGLMTRHRRRRSARKPPSPRYLRRWVAPPPKHVPSDPSYIPGAIAYKMVGYGVYPGGHG